MPNPTPPNLVDVLALTLIPGLGPVLISRALRALGGPAGVLSAPPERLRTVPGVGPERAKLFAQHRAEAERKAAIEAARAADLGVGLVALGMDGYPPLLAQMPDAPPVLYVRGRLEPEGADRYSVAIVGSRDCTPYGREQAARFAGGLAQAGLTVVSGGARGIDSAAHRAALRAGGRTVIVLGSGANVPYPPENAGFFDEAVAAGSAVISELPLDTPPSPETFPTRNRVIAGLSLGVLVIEAAQRSGALITARLAAEDLGREVFALPGRVDSSASAGSLNLLKAGGAHLVTAPADVLEILREPARHHHGGTHADRFLPLAEPEDAREPALFESKPDAQPATGNDLRTASLTDRQRAVLDALVEPRTVDDLCRALNTDPATLRADLTMLELRRCIAREGSRVARRAGG